jgi:DnaJ family protein A protein 5
VYGDLFRQLDKEEEMEEEVGVEHDDVLFGDLYSSMEDVYRFYSHYQNFATNKQFAYADTFNPNQAPNRKVKRIIEVENTKERNLERKKFNDLVI